MFFDILKGDKNEKANKLACCPWGVSLGGVSGSLNAAQDGGQIASGMLGYASGKAGANKDPWIQGVALEPLP